MEIHKKIMKIYKEDYAETMDNRSKKEKDLNDKHWREIQRMMNE